MPTENYHNLLSSISPGQQLHNVNRRSAIGAIAAAQQEDLITDQEAREMLQTLAAVFVIGEINAVVSGFFTPDDAGRLGRRFGPENPYT